MRVFNPDINPDDRFDARTHAGFVELDHSKHIALISNGQRRHRFGSLGHQLFDAHYAVDQRILSVNAKMYKLGCHDVS